MYCGGLDSRMRTSTPSIGASTSCRPDDEEELGTDDEGEPGITSLADAHVMADRDASTATPVAIVSLVFLIMTFQTRLLPIRLHLTDWHRDGPGVNGTTRHNPNRLRKYIEARGSTDASSEIGKQCLHRLIRAEPTRRSYP
jgi:hypothetical protein